MRFCILLVTGLVIGTVGYANDLQLTPVPGLEVPDSAIDRLKALLEGRNVPSGCYDHKSYSENDILRAIISHVWLRTEVANSSSSHPSYQVMTKSVQDTLPVAAYLTNKVSQGECSMAQHRAFILMTNTVVQAGGPGGEAITFDPTQSKPAATESQSQGSSQ